ncbi:Glutathione-specific gamma-glutamylcyclotransferase 1 [Amphibalanus amphitrite]|uniref:glutathione-specific gamma-glutamylcyclotransferase n=1 Tax=Amphibalanus amphitrite TaxID=1232801 RepID=A0A6A4WVT6_AMPAM|nr:glutathione-specific gamma-glutamylcyclotransferase 1-like [Amphibalanus amphitrite]XP_043217057.1 glutathione-specific gamma-glutamylcyclotransferase 1-like [Amphibalanus amphitrite]KAF0311267.1 Glutathione-specific gamma-glutamylcyclotransferase 1 [Amphibalanus amphitrite]
MASHSLWVFGYGSLCWYPGFEYRSSRIGHIKGFSRRFWQGNTTHRGVPGKPGRVATLVEDGETFTHGVAYELVGEAALSYLNGREVTLGGYTTLFTEFYPREGAAFPALLYVATPSSQHWLGNAPLHQIADQVVSSRGASGHNVEYVLRLAEFMHEHVPECRDEHLFQLEQLVRLRVKEARLCLRTLMGERAPSPVSSSEDEEVAPAAQRTTSFQFTSAVPAKKLRCLGV